MTRTLIPPSHRRSVWLIPLALLTLAAPASADIKTWIGGASTWDNDNAWFPANQPQNGDQVLINQSGAIVMYTSPANPAAVYSDLEIDSAGANLSTFTQSANTLNTNQLLIGIMSKGAVTQSGGAMNVLDPSIGMSLGSSISGNGTYTLSGSAVLTVAGQVIIGDVATGTINQSGGRLIVTPLGSFPGQLVLASNAGSNGTYNLSAGSVESGSLVLSPFGGVANFTHSAGSVTLSADLSLGDPTIPNLAGSAFYNHTGGAVSSQAINIGSTGTLKQAGGTLRTAQLTINTAGGKLDLTNQSMVIDYTGSSPLATIRSYIKSGYNGGAWNGGGITTSASLSAKAVAYAEASDLLGLTGANTANWNNQLVDATSLLLRFTLAGDANMDGAVNFTDLVRVAQNYGNTTGAAVWTKGDFNYDGNIDFPDLVLVAQNYGAALPAAPIPGATAAFEADLARAFASVPEPSTFFLLLTAAAYTLPRRRRNRLPRRKITSTPAA